MSQLDKDAAKRAAAGESLGAFITFDVNRLEKDELILLGKKMALESMAGFVAQGVAVARKRFNPDLLSSLLELQAIINNDAEKVTLELSRSALRRKTAVMREIPKDAQ
jgi:hypothetical protein